jgi:hypothetical protein
VVGAAGAGVELLAADVVGDAGDAVVDDASAARGAMGVASLVEVAAGAASLVEEAAGAASLVEEAAGAASLVALAAGAASVAAPDKVTGAATVVASDGVAGATVALVGLPEGSVAFLGSTATTVVVGVVVVTSGAAVEAAGVGGTGAVRITAVSFGFCSVSFLGSWLTNSKVFDNASGLKIPCC